MMRILAASLAAALLLGCEPDGVPTAPDDDFPTLRAAAAVAPGGTVALTTGLTATPITWTVNGQAGGNAEVGLISPTGIYTAPAEIPADSVVVAMFPQAKPDSIQQSVVYFVPSGDSESYHYIVPRVVDQTNPKSIRVLASRAGVSSMLLTPLTGPPIAFQSLGNSVFRGVIPHAVAVAGYRAGTLHNFVGFLDEFDAGGSRLRRVNLVLNIREAAHPAVTITAISPMAQRSPYILNLRHDAVTVNATPQIVTQAVAALGSTAFDFVSVIASVNTTNNRNYQAIRNDVSGIALTNFDNSAMWGSGARALGAISYPIDSYFDAAELGSLHEIGHRWISFSNHSLLQPGVPHWPLSSMASGIMGFSMAGGVGGTFPYTFTDLGDGTVRVTRLALPSTMRFDPLDLYLMGLLPADSVPPRLILPPTTTFAELTDGAILLATPFTVEQFIAAHGARNPSHLTAPREFQMVVVILSPLRLLSAAEMAFFDAAVARGETEVELAAQSGFSTAPAPGFFIATGGRARLRTLLP